MPMPKPKLKTWIRREDPVARSARALWCRLDKQVAAQFKKSRYVEPRVVEPVNQDIQADKAA